MQAFLEEAKKSSRTIANLSTAVKNRVLNEMADALMNHCDFIISNNEKDMSPFPNSIETLNSWNPPS